MNQEQNNFDQQGINGIPDNQPLENNLDAQIQNIGDSSLDNKTPKKTNKVIIIGIIIIILSLIFGTVIFVLKNEKEENKSDNEIKQEIKKSPYWISGNSLEAFDLYFLQLENGKQNKIYSPLSIKYALAMLEEGAEGESKAQISNVIGDYQVRKYDNSENMSFANAMFIKDTYKNSIKDSYINSLTSKYNAEIKIDSFSTPDGANAWIKDKTLGLIDKLFDDISSEYFLLINALAIDMEWQEKFMRYSANGVTARYLHEKFSWHGDYDIMPKQFKGLSEEVAGMEIIASFNNYDIVNELGEEKIRQTVKDAYIEYLKDYPDQKFGYDLYFPGKTDDLSEEEMMEKYLDHYIEEINFNYKREDRTTDFSIYIDNEIKVFAKDLKEYDGTTLQYVGIMPINQDLNSYINEVTASDISNVISNLKSLKAENFKDGVVTKITGFVPKFKFEYELKLMDNLRKLGIKNVFEQEKANLTKISSDKSLYINSAKHKANIEFTQDGIKASAATAFGGMGAGASFDYLFDVPVEEIDLTFDKPYMFIIRDKNTGEAWFVGTVYNPLLYSQDTTVIRRN